MLSIFENSTKTVIAIDAEYKTIRFYYKNQDGKIKLSSTIFTSEPFTKPFYDEFGKIVASLSQSFPSMQTKKVTLLIPDSVVFTDVINIPIVNKRQMEKSLQVAFDSVYLSLESGKEEEKAEEKKGISLFKKKEEKPSKQAPKQNADDEIKVNTWFNYNKFIGAQNKKYATYGIIATRGDIIANLHNSCAFAQVSIAGISYFSNAVTNSALNLNPKLKHGSFVILDVKQNSSKIIFVVKGMTFGVYPLPFGYSALDGGRIIPEDLLFAHENSEKIVAQSKQKAKSSKPISVSEDSSEVITEIEEVSEREEENLTEENGESENVIAITESDDDEESLPITEGLKFNKEGRKLPKFMQRPTPTTADGFMQENFRLFVKWTLDVIANNTSITALAMPDTVYVNLPKQFYGVIEKENENYGDNKIKFLPLIESEILPRILNNLDLYGGFFVTSYNKTSNF